MGNKLEGEAQQREQKGSWDIKLPEQIFQHDCEVLKREPLEGGQHIYCDDEEYMAFDGGTKRWFKNRKVHRDNDLPAVIEANGDMLWYQNGKLHREGGKPAVVFHNGRKDYYLNGKLYKTDASAFKRVKESFGIYK